METSIVIAGLIVSHLLVAYGAVRLFQYGLLYGRHWNYQEKINDAPTVPSQVPSRAKPAPLTMGDWDKPIPGPELDFRSENPNPFAEPAIGGKDAIPPAPNV
jgi:hypothetical protein